MQTCGSFEILRIYIGSILEQQMCHLHALGSDVIKK